MNRRIIRLMGQILTTALLSAATCLAQGLPNQPDLPIDAAVRTEVIEALIKELNEKYIFPEVAKQLEKDLRERLVRKEYDNLTSAAVFSRTLTKHLREISHDKHLDVSYSYRMLPPMFRPGEAPPGPPLGANLAAKLNFGFEKVERLSGNIGYLKLNGFMDPQTGTGDVATAAMNFLSNTDALIIDLRQNNGGMPGMVALLCSYFFAGPPVHLNDIQWRTPEGNHIQQSWTLSYVPGKRYINKEVYILTSKFTFSAAEEFTYNLKTQKRATIVGETSGGGANPGGGVRLQDHFIAFIPTGQAINPITKTNWEGTGITPDIAVPAEQALYVAQLTALQHLLGKNTDERLGIELKRAIEAVEKELNALKNK
ncbi:MAG: S41 family peptidase [Acidobacteriota bacterium]